MEATNDHTPDFENLASDQAALLAALEATCWPDSGRRALHPLGPVFH
jgi:hypothetical protein